MNDVAWLPSLLVLGIGLAIGLAAGAAVRRGRRDKTAKAEQELRLRDLEARRDDLYRRLRSPDLNEGDRDSLELAAAHTLKELERLAPKRGRAKPPEPAPSPAPPAAPAAAPRSGIRHPALVGFVAGMAVVLLVGWLVYLAFRDSGAATAVPQTASGSAEAPHPDSGELPAEARRELERLEAAVAAAPDDLLARKRLALARLDAGLYFDAYRDAEAILASRAEDPDGLFIQGVVRVTMGQNEPAVELLDRVLARFPEHLQAMIYRGLALAQAGSVDQALDTWEIALDMAGGRHPELERLIQMAREPQGGALPGPQAAAPPAAAPPATPPAAGPGPTPAGPAYRATVTLAPGARPPGGAVLFFSLLPAGGGPPVAVQRIESPRFPLELELDQRHSMMGAELPGEGVLVARLDADGSASTRGPGDLEARSEASAGARLSLVLSGGG